MRSLIVVAAALVLTVAAAAAAPHGISQRSIAGVKLGMTKAQVKAILGSTSKRAGTYDNPGQPDGWTALVSVKHKVSVYFEHGSNKAVRAQLAASVSSFRARSTTATRGRCTSTDRKHRYSGTSQTAPSGGNVSVAENGCSCHGTASASTPPRLPTPLPP